MARAPRPRARRDAHRAGVGIDDLRPGRPAAACCRRSGPYWHTRGHSREAQAWFARALAEAPDRAGRLACPRALGVGVPGDLHERRSSSASVEPRRRSSSRKRSAISARSPARMDSSRERSCSSPIPLGAQPTFREAAALADSEGDIWCQIDCLQKAAYSDYYRDRWPEAIDGEHRGRATRSIDREPVLPLLERPRSTAPLPGGRAGSGGSEAAHAQRARCRARARRAD